ncbi:MAG: hypothetical protein ACRETA_14100 [Gammaproteobacteria bacterium]
MNIAVRLVANAAVCAISMLAATPAFASDASDVQATVERWVVNINKGDFKSVIAACAPHASIIDGFPPYAWQTCADWMHDYKANNKTIQANLGTLSMGRPIYSELHGGHAYFIYPVTFTDTQKSQQVIYKGAMTMVLQKAQSGWVITGQASAWGVNTLQSLPKH